MSIDVYEVVKRLIGEIAPVADSGIDEIRLENLRQMTALVDALLQDIHELRRLSGRREDSLRQAARRADKFFDHVRTQYTEVQQ